MLPARTNLRRRPPATRLATPPAVPTSRCPLAPQRHAGTRYPPRAHARSPPAENKRPLPCTPQARFDAAVASNPENANIKPTKRKSSGKSSGGPKALSSYMHFCAERRASLTAELKAELGAGFENKMVMVKLGAEWKAMGDGAKAKYVAMNEAQKAELAAAAASGI